jgi:hypothetical protein
MMRQTVDIPSAIDSMNGYPFKFVHPMRMRSLRKEADRQLLNKRPAREVAANVKNVLTYGRKNREGGYVLPNVHHKSKIFSGGHNLHRTLELARLGQRRPSSSRTHSSAPNSGDTGAISEAGGGWATDESTSMRKGG